MRKKGNVLKPIFYDGNILQSCTSTSHGFIVQRGQEENKSLGGGSIKTKTL